MFAKRFISAAIIGALLSQLVACGTILHPQRKGQKDGNLDPSIVILDGIGLLFFIVPGVIAFAADFSNGTIYLPGGKRADATSADSAARMVYLGDSIHDPSVVASVLSQVTGQSIDAEKIKKQVKTQSVVTLL